MKASFRWLGLIVSFLLLLTGCGIRTQNTVMEDIQGLRNHLPSYQIQASMEVHTSANSVQHYQIETKFKSATQYKITLANASGQINQIVVRNSDGLFVVSPQTKKAFRFQGEWVESQGQAYLFHLLLDRIIQTKDREYSTGKDGTLFFAFPMASNTPWVSKQKVYLDGKSLFPKQLQYLDKEGRVVVNVTYSGLQRDAKFSDHEFQIASVLTSAGTEVPVLSKPKERIAIEPGYLPKGITKLDETKTPNGIVLRYQTPAGVMSIQESYAYDSSSTIDPNGQIYDLFGAPAVASVSNDSTLLEWTDQGVAYSLVSKLPISELWDIANSMIH